MADIYIVDDDRAVRFVLATALRDAGHVVTEFVDAATARRALQHAAPDLLISDVRLPGDDGLALLREAKAAHPDLPVLVMSAYTDVTTTRRRTAKARRITWRSLSTSRMRWLWHNVRSANRCRRDNPRAPRCRAMHCSAKASQCAKCSA